MLTEDQILFLNKFCANKWKNNNDIINIYGNIVIQDTNLTQIPVQFGHVSGHYDCQYNKLTTLKGLPSIIEKYFTCECNKLSTLTEGPKEVGEYYSCGYNQLISLIGAPEVCNGNFWSEKNKLTSLEGCPSIIKGNLYITENPDLHILYGIGQVEGKIYYDNRNDLNEWIIEQAQKNIFVSYTDIAKWIKRNNKLEFLLNAQSEIRQHFSPRILHLVDSGVYNESKIFDFKKFINKI